MTLLLEASSEGIQVLLLLEHLVELLERVAAVAPAATPAAVPGGAVGAGKVGRVRGRGGGGLGLDGAGLEGGGGSGHGGSGWGGPVQEASCCGHGPSLLLVQMGLAHAAG